MKAATPIHPAPSAKMGFGNIRPRFVEEYAAWQHNRFLRIWQRLQDAALYKNSNSSSSGTFR